MNPNFTEIAFVLDRSGSMSSMAAAAIDGFNHFLRAQQHAPGHARLTLVLFDDEYLLPVDRLPVAEVLPLDHSSYRPRNSTALLDAIGRTIERLGANLAAMAEPDRPGTVIVAILTDGLENASQQYTWRDVAERIRHQTAVYRWEFLFLGANQDAIATAAQLNIAPANAATYVADAIGTRSTGAALARKSTALRKRESGGLSNQEALDIEAPLSQLVHEEDVQEREKDE